jgi:hypothetical protein
MIDDKKMIETKYKLNFLIKLSVIMLISSIISGFIFYNIVNYDIGNTYTSARFAIKSVNDFLFPSLWLAVTIFTLLLSICTIIITVFVSHKIAGPIYRLEMTMSDFKEGVFYKVNLRDKDQLKEIVKHLNEFTEALIDNFTRAKKYSLNIKGLIDEEKKECGKDDIDYEQLKTLNVRLDKEIKGIKDIMATYKTNL